MTELIGAIDQGTSSTRFLVLDDQGEVVASAQKEHKQIYPKPGWVEHDPMEIWANTKDVVAGALGRAGIEASDLAGVGITNQRETTVLWDRSTGEPVANAIVWQDTRTAQLVEELGGADGPGRYTARTGLPLATYFAGPKARWLIDTLGLREQADRGELAFGTIDSWLAWQLTGRHVTDVTNASRTLLMDLATAAWDSDLATEMGVPSHILPEIVPSVGHIGECGDVLAGTSLTTILGDQHAALFGQACFQPGEAKNTYGTGNFMLMNTGTEPVPSQAGLLSTVGYQVAGQPIVYSLEGSIAVTGSLIQWLRDNLGIISSNAEIEALAATVEDNGEVYFVPAFSGLFAPHWRPDARGVITGITNFTNKGHIARAALEAAAYQTRDVLVAMVVDSGIDLTEMRVDGGMTVNDGLMQFQADLLGVDVVRPAMTETTALGAAYGAGMAAGVWSGLDELASMWTEEARFSPAMPEERRAHLVSGWDRAVQRSLGLA